MSVATSRLRSRTTTDRAMAAARSAIAKIPRHQETPNSPRVAVPGTLMGIKLDVPPTQYRPPITTNLRYLASQYSLSDFFSGVGGSALGALWAGIGETISYNHWPEAVACHAVNIGGAHFVADLNQIHNLANMSVAQASMPELFAYTDLLWNSAPCTPNSGARTKGKDAKSDTRTPEQRAEALKKARGSMYSGLEFAAIHHPLAVITENVTEIMTRFVGLRGWLQSWEDYGYVTVICHTNSMFVGPLAERVMQSRDRTYFVHILKQYAHNLDMRMSVEGECRSCHRTVEAEQTWKNGRTFGKYRTQYIYTCPRCHEEVIPPTNGLDQAIDLTDLGTPIADRTLGLTTLTRIQNGLDNLIAQGLPAQPLIVTQDRSNQPEIKPARPWTLTGQTLTGRQVLGVVTHPAMLTGDTRPARSLPSAGECNFRMVSPRELSTISGFPDTYEWVGSKRDVALATGNCVTPRVSQHKWERVIAALG